MLSTENKAQLIQLQHAIRLLRQVFGPQLRASQIDGLLTVALRNGMTQSELASEIGITPAAISRQIDVLGVTGRQDGIGGKAGVVTIQRDLADDRVKRVSLTPAGEQFVQLLSQLMGAA